MRVHVGHTQRSAILAVTQSDSPLGVPKVTARHRGKFKHDMSQLRCGQKYCMGLVSAQLNSKPM